METKTQRDIRIVAVGHKIPILNLDQVRKKEEDLEQSNRLD